MHASIPLPAVVSGDSVKEVASQRRHRMAILGDTHNSVITQPGLAILSTLKYSQVRYRLWREVLAVQMFQPLDGCRR